jgi:hypothetical protein
VLNGKVEKMKDGRWNRRNRRKRMSRSRRCTEEWKQMEENRITNVEEKGQ